MLKKREESKMLFIKNAYNWAKENLLIVGAAIGGIFTLILTLVLNREDDSTQIALESKKESNQARKERDEEARQLTEKFIADVEEAKKQAADKGEQLSKKQEKKLTERLEAFSTADSEEEKQEIAKDIQEVFPFLDMVDPSRFGKVE